MTPTFPTMAGPRLAFHPTSLAIPARPADAEAMAAHLDRAADWHLSEGRGALADKLANLALEARCRARGGRA